MHQHRVILIISGTLVFLDKVSFFHDIHAIIPGRIEEDVLVAAVFNGLGVVDAGDLGKFLEARILRDPQNDNGIVSD